jgi:hypothetical protein
LAGEQAKRGKQNPRLCERAAERLLPPAHRVVVTDGAATIAETGAIIEYLVNKVDVLAAALRLVYRFGQVRSKGR